MTPDEAAKAVLADQLAPSQMKFSEFRWAMIAECDGYISDDDIHDLFLKHVVNPALGWSSFTTFTNERGEEYSVPTTPLPEEFMCDDCCVRMDQRPRFDCSNARHTVAYVNDSTGKVKAVDQVVEWAEKQRPSEREVRKVARKPDPTLARRVSKSRKKHWSEVTLGEALDKVKRVLKNSRFRA